MFLVLGFRIVLNTVCFIITVFWLKSACLDSAFCTEKGYNSITRNSSQQILSSFFNLESHPRWSLLEPEISQKLPSYDSLLGKLHSLLKECPQIVQVYPIGHAHGSQNTWAVSIGDNPEIHEEGEIEINLMGDTRGNDPFSPELLLLLTKLLCMNYERDEGITYLLTHTQIHILPSLDPGGLKVSPNDNIPLGTLMQRRTSHRNYFHPFRTIHTEEQKELVLLRWTSSRPFLVSASLHAGSTAAVDGHTIFSDHLARRGTLIDNATVEQLTSRFNKAQRQMKSGVTECTQNGSASMLDWNDFYSGCIGLTLQLGCTESPQSSTISAYWKRNKFALLAFIAQVHRALRGYVINGVTGLPVGNATIHVQNSSHLVWSTAELGEYWRLLPTEGSFVLWASKEGFFNSSSITINATELPFVRQSGKEQWNFTLWPDKAPQWSRVLDFDNMPNRMPAYTPNVQDAFQSIIDSLEFNEFISVRSLNVSGEKLIGIEVAVESNESKANVQRNSGQPIRRIPGRIRVLIMAGTFDADVVSVEMCLRFTRHLVRGLDLIDRRVDYLTSTQLVIIPYLNSTAVKAFTANLTEQSAVEFERIRCTSSGEGNHPKQLKSSTVLPTVVQQFIRAYAPHVLLTLESAHWRDHEWHMNGRKILLPVKPIYVPSEKMSKISTLDFIHNLIEQYLSDVGFYRQPSGDCSSTEGVRSITSTLHEELKQTLDSLPKDGLITPIGLAVRLACQRCPGVLLPQNLPELWHTTLSTVSGFLSTIHNLSFRGQLLIENDPNLDSRSDSAHHHWFGSNWVPSGDAHLLIQPASTFLQQHFTRMRGMGSLPSINISSWVQLPVDFESGAFGTLLPAGTYLIYALAGPPNSLLAKEYDEMTTAVLLRPDQDNGRNLIGLERGLDEIRYNGLEHMTEQLRQMTTPETVKCGSLQRIGQSRSGHPIHVFELGLGISSLPRNTSSGESELFRSTKKSRDDDYYASPLSRVVLFGNMHGHDLLTPQLLVHFVEWLCDSHSRNSAVQRMFSRVRLAVVPFPNPDGLSRAFSRYDPDPIPPSSIHGYSQQKSCSGRFALHNPAQQGMPNAALDDLWEELIFVTQKHSNRSKRWWWEDTKHANLSTLQPENTALISWLRDYQPTAIFSFADSQDSEVNYGVDPTETEFANNLSADVHDWLRYLSHLLSPAFREPPSICSRSRYMTDSTNFTELTALALALASISPNSATDHHDALPSPTFRLPLPLHGPISLGISLCPGCLSPTSTGTAGVWKKFRFPSLLLGLIGQATLSVSGSSGLIGEVKSTTGNSVPVARVHLANVRSELKTNMSVDHGRFRIVLPPGVFRMSIRALGFVDLTELITIDALRGPTFHVFRLTPLGSPWGELYTRAVVVIGTITAVILCLATLWIAYCYCCLPRSTYAMARRMAVKHAALSKSEETAAEGNQSTYRLLPIDSQGFEEVVASDVEYTLTATPHRIPKVIAKGRQSKNRYVPLPQEDDEFDEVELA